MPLHRLIHFCITCRTADDEPVSFFLHRLIYSEPPHGNGIIMKHLPRSTACATASGIKAVTVELQEFNSRYASEYGTWFFDYPDPPAQIAGVVVDNLLFQFPFDAQFPFT